MHQKCCFCARSCFHVLSLFVLPLRGPRYKQWILWKRTCHLTDGDLLGSFLGLQTWSHCPSCSEAWVGTPRSRSSGKAGAFAPNVWHMKDGKASLLPMLHNLRRGDTMGTPLLRKALPNVDQWTCADRCSGVIEGVSHLQNPSTPSPSMGFFDTPAGHPAISYAAAPPSRFRSASALHPAEPALQVC